MSPAEFLADEIDKNPSTLVDYADQNEIGELYANLYALLRNPVASVQYQDAEAFLQRHICNAIERHKNMNSERGAEAAKEYLDNLMLEKEAA